MELNSAAALPMLSVSRSPHEYEALHQDDECSFPEPKKVLSRILAHKGSGNKARRVGKEELVKLGLKFSRVHKELVLNPEGFVISRLDPEFKQVLDRTFPGRTRAMRLNLLVAVLITIILPFGYARTAMTYSCLLDKFWLSDSLKADPDWEGAPLECTSVHKNKVQGNDLIQEGMRSTSVLGIDLGGSYFPVWHVFDMGVPKTVAGVAMTALDMKLSPQKLNIKFAYGAEAEDPFSADWATALDTSVKHPWVQTKTWSLNTAYTARFWRVNIGIGFNGSSPAVCCISFFGQKGRPDLDPSHQILLARDGCSMEDRLRSPWSVLFGVVVVSVSFALTLLMRGLTHCFSWCYKSFGSEFWLYLKRWIWKPLLLLWYMKVGPACAKMRYANNSNLIPGLYNPPSVWVCWLYIIVFAESLFLGYCYSHIGLGAIFAYAVGEVMLAVLNWLLQPREAIINAIASMISDWRPPSVEFENGLTLPTILDRLQQTMEHPSPMRSISSMHISIEELMHAGEVLAVGSTGKSDALFHFEGDDTIDSVGLIERVMVRGMLQICEIDLLARTVNDLYVAST